MKALLKARTLRNTLISAAAASAMTLPLLSSATMAHTANSDVRVSYEKTELARPGGQKLLYARLKSASRKICGSSSIRITGSVHNSVAKTQCFDETLSAAVARLANAEIAALHSR